MQRLMTINLRTFPKSLAPGNVRRTAITERKPRTRIRTLTRAIAEISTIAISTGLGSTANDSSQPVAALSAGEPCPEIEGMLFRGHEIIFSPVGNYPPERESRPTNNISVLRYAPLGKVTVEAAPTKEAAKKRRPEKWLATAGALPVGQPGSKEEVNDKSESEDKSGNEKQDPYFDHRKNEERKHNKP